MTPWPAARPGDLLNVINMPALTFDLNPFGHAMLVRTTATHAVLVNLDVPALL